MRYFTSDTHFGHPLVTALRGFLNNGRLRTEYRDVWQAQGRAAAHAWIKQYVRDNQTSFKAICDITRHENTIIGNINETVGRDDELWILGDLSYRCTVEHTLDCLRRINCRHLHLIIGNHDRNFRLRSNDALYENVFETIAMGKVSASAVEAKELGLVRKDDVVAFNAYELLHIAKQEALALAERGYRPPLPARRVQVAGDVGIATFKMLLVNMLEGRFISPHDYEIATRIATVLCGGEIERGSLVDEDWLLRLEREHFVALAQMPKTQERIAHMLKTGKPLRN